MLKDSILHYNEISVLYLQGKSLTTLEQEFKVERHKLSKALIEDGISIRQDNKKYIYNEDFFDVIDSEEKAYWLGFIMADGWIERSSKRYVLGIILAECDEQHLIKLQTVLCPENKITNKIISLNGKEYVAKRLQINNKRIVESLISKGCTPSKSLTLEFPSSSIVPDELVRHYIRGYFDGDGSIYSTNTFTNQIAQINLSFTGTKDFLVSVQRKFLEQISDYKEVSISKDNKSKASHFVKGGYRSCINVLLYMYGTSCIYLDRKYDKLVKFLESNLPS